MTASLRRPFAVPLLGSILILSGCISNPPHANSDQGAAGTAYLSDDPAPSLDVPPDPATYRLFRPVPRAPVTYRPPSPVAEPPPGDLWERIRRGFALPDRYHPRLRQEQKWVADNPRFLVRAAEQAQPYLYHVVEELERRGIPLEVALLPAIESGFRPLALSPGQAAGLWQFIPSTADALGLKRSQWYEGRFDVEASTRAALDYLEKLAEQFDGDWELALAAYNAGPGTVQRAVRKNEEQGLPTNYWSLDLPPETGTYVPRLLAVAQAVEDPESAGLTLPAISNQPYFARVELPGQMDLSLAARLADLPVAELKSLNPGHLRSKTAPDGPQSLLVPVERADDFSRRLSQVAGEQLAVGHRYKVRKGDTLDTVARHHGLTPEQLKLANGLKNGKLTPGQQLQIPSADDPVVQVAQAAPAPTKTPAAAPPQGSDKTYRVRSGDSLWGIAKAKGLDHRQLAAWNGLAEGGALRPGQELRLTQAAPGIAYRVKKGDSIHGIARRFNVSVQEILSWNERSDPDLKPGEQITLYVDSSKRRSTL